MLIINKIPTKLVSYQQIHKEPYFIGLRLKKTTGGETSKLQGKTL